MAGLSCAAINWHKNIHPPEMEINPLKTVCGYACGGIINLFRKTVTHAILSPHRTHLSMHTCILGDPPSVQQVGMLQHNVTGVGVGGLLFITDLKLL